MGVVNAQEYPTDWVLYTSGGYMYDIETDYNTKNQSETDFKNYLLNIARTNLAKQIQIKVEDVANLAKNSQNGITTINYSTNTSFSTNVELKLVETRTTYDANSKIGSAIAYIDKVRALNYYRNELLLLYNKLDNAVVLANNYIEAGFKSKAKDELENSTKLFTLVEEPIFWMNMFGCSQHEQKEMLDTFSSKEQNIKQMLSELQHSLTIYLQCNADMFGNKYVALQGELKGELSKLGCSFVNAPDAADYIVEVNASAREYNIYQMGNISTYHVYVDANYSITKAATMQRIYEDEISVKGSHTHNYGQAARAAYKDISKELAPILKEQIK